MDFGMDIFAQLTVLTAWIGIQILMLVNAPEELTHSMEIVFPVELWMEILQEENVNVQVQRLILMGILAQHVTKIEIGMPFQQYVNAQ